MVVELESLLLMSFFMRDMIYCDNGPSGDVP